MKNQSEQTPSKVTKVLVDKIHGGRKQDSKFWQSEFSEPKKEPIKQEPKKDLISQKHLLFSYSSL